MRHFVFAATGAAIGVAAVFGVPWLVQRAADVTRPPEVWMEFRNLAAEDTTVGVAPVVTAERIIHRSLLATTRATLRQVDPTDEQMVTVCSRSSARHLIPRSKLPDPATWDYWSEVPPNLPCVPEEPGTYVVTLWIGVDGDAGARTAPIELMSNEFEVRP